MAENIDYAAMLADLEAKKASLEAAIAAVRSAIAMGAAGQPADVSATASTSSGGVPSLHNGEVPAGAFLGKSIPEAAKLYLAIVKRKQTSKEIAEGLKKGGIESTAKNFFGIVHSILDRTRKSGGGIVKLDRSYWGLAEWYPRGVASAPAAAPKKGKGKKKGRKTAGQKHEPQGEAIASAPIARPGKGLNGRMLEILKQNPHQEFSAEQLGKQLGAHPRIVSMQMSKLVSSRQAEKTAAGGYRAVSNIRPMPAAAAAI